jgi:hypothetical protein
MKIEQEKQSKNQHATKMITDAKQQVQMSKLQTSQGRHEMKKTMQASKLYGLKQEAKKAGSHIFR